MQKIDLTAKTVLVTGAAGFIGSNLVMELFRTIKDNQHYRDRQHERLLRCFY